MLQKRFGSPVSSLFHISHWYSSQTLSFQKWKEGKALLSGMRAWAGSHHNSDTRSNVTIPQSVGAKLISSSSPQTGPPFNFMSVLSTFKFPVFWAVNPGVKKERNLGEFWNSSLPFICGQGYHLFFLTITQTHSSSPFPLPNP